MKRLVLLIMVFGLLFGCQSFTDFFYGPDLTPEQLKDAVYSDAYALGQIQGAKAGVDKDKLISEAENVRNAADPHNYMTTKFLDALRDGETEHAFIWYTARRLYERLGVQLQQDAYDYVGFDKDLFNYAVDAFIDGVNRK